MSISKPLLDIRALAATPFLLLAQKKEDERKERPGVPPYGYPALLVISGALPTGYPYPAQEDRLLTHREVGNAKRLLGAILALSVPFGPIPLTTAMLGVTHGIMGRQP